MGIMLSGSRYVLDKESEDKILELATTDLKDRHSGEYQKSLERFREIVYLQEVAKQKKYLETRHPEQVNQIYNLRAILNHERGG
jgi:hypothetical protein